MKKSTKHIAIPLIIPAVFFIVASLPVDLLGCRNRGLIAVFLAILAGIFGVGAAFKGVINKAKKDPNSYLWIISALILSIPAVYIVIIAG